LRQPCVDACGADTTRRTVSPALGDRPRRSTAPRGPRDAHRVEHQPDRARVVAPGAGMLSRSLRRRGARCPRVALNVGEKIPARQPGGLTCGGPGRLPAIARKIEQRRRRRSLQSTLRARGRKAPARRSAELARGSGAPPRSRQAPRSAPAACVPMAR
jgi:hypothetical protein